MGGNIRLMAHERVPESFCTAHRLRISGLRRQFMKPRVYHPNQFALAVHHRDRNRFFVNVHADILLNVHMGAPFGRVLDHTQTLLQRVALL
jgi:hypothetical protein